MHSGSCSDSRGPGGEANLSDIHYIIWQGEAKYCIITLTSVFHHILRVGLKQLCAYAHLGCAHKASTSH